MKERVLDEKEANRINGLVKNKNVLGKEYLEEGFCLTVLVEGKKYLLYYDHQTWFMGVGSEILEE